MKESHGEGGAGAICLLPVLSCTTQVKKQERKGQEQEKKRETNTQTMSQQASTGHVLFWSEKGVYSQGEPNHMNKSKNRYEIGGSHLPIFDYF